RHTCALLDDGSIKCWGWNNLGQLGIGDTNSRGDQPGEMGNALPRVHLGADHTATAIAAGVFNTCAILETRELECWGSNSSGQLSTGDTSARGDNSGELGSHLPSINLGVDRWAQSVAVAPQHVCALRDDGQVACWGSSKHGQLGLENIEAVRITSDSFGSALKPVDLEF
ncbi:RCC1 domain-containing protein, partial [Myxococcota bacterium]